MDRSRALIHLKPRGYTPLPAAAIRETAAADPGLSLEDLAAQFGGTPSSISRILTGESQPDAGGPIMLQSRRPGRPRNDGPVARVTVELPPELRRRIDAARGPESMSAWLRGAAESRLTSTPGDASPGTPDGGPRG